MLSATARSISGTKPAGYLRHRSAHL